MKFYEGEKVQPTLMTGAGNIPKGTFHGADLVPPGTFH